MMPSVRSSEAVATGHFPLARRFALLVCLLACSWLGAGRASAQVDVTASGGTLNASYTTLKGAFDAINAGTHTGTITIGISGDTTETAPAVLNASGAGSASYATIGISPTGGAARTITGAIVAGSPLIDLNGADNVTIDGLNTGGNSLTIANTTVSATAGTSTIRFIGGATFNLITNSNVQGSSSSAITIAGGTIFFSTDAVTTTGNDNNTILNNNIGPAGANLPSKAIFGLGSTTTAALGNSGILISNNNIFDYFAAATTSAGIATNGGCNTWTITGNRFYQTATRTWTTGSLHNAINIGNSTATSGAQAFTITFNIVGFASNTQTGVYTLTGSTGKFIGIVFNGITGGTLTAMSNNTVAAVSLTGVTSNGTSTASPMIGILITNGLVNSGNNTIGSQTATGSLTFSTNTTTATDTIGIYNFSVDDWTATGNSVGGISVTNAGASGTFILYGMRANTSTAKSWTATSNLVGGTVANSLQLTSTGTASQVIGMVTTNAAANWTSNTVRNLTNNNGTGTTTAASVIGMSVTTTTPNHTLSQNTIFNLSNTNATAATIVTGIQFTGATANVVQRNLIYGLTSATTSATAEVNGIRVAGGTTIYRNNMIAIGAGIANALGGVATNGGTTGINGINEFLGTNSFFHNSVYIGGAPTAGTGASYAFNGTQTINVRSFRDNAFMNARSNAGATGKNYAVKINGTTPNPTGLTINNNVYFANGTGAVFGFFNGLDVANLAAWKTAVGQDAASIEGNPAYNDPTNATPDLHIHPTNPTVIEGNGVDVGVTDDFDGQTRASFTPVDIGADAGNFNGIDLVAPNITYAPLLNTSLTTNRILSATITDVSGVATGGLAPRVYYRKNAGAYVSQGCTLASGTVNNGTWSCTIDNSALGGVAISDVINYFAVAQDVGGNVGSNPPGVAATDVNTVITPPATPNAYTIVTGFSGPLNVGSTETFTSLTNAGGIFEALNNGALTGNVILNITSDLAGELGTHPLNQWPEDGVGGYTLLIRPSGAPRSIVGTNAGALIRLNGADRVRIDGSTAATLAGLPGSSTLIGGNPALRELTIQNTNTGTSAVVIAVQSGATGAQNDTIRNVNVLGQDPTTTLAGIAFGGATPGTAGVDNDNNRIENCTVKRSIYGIYMSGANIANPDVGNVITMNDISATGADRVRRVGMTTFFQDGIQVTENSVGGLDTNESADGMAIGIGAQGVDNALVASGGITNAFISRNRVSGVLSQSTTGFSAVGIAISGAPGGSNTIVNNMISGLSAPATSPDVVAGIFVVGVPGSSTRVLHNSVHLTGDRGTVATQSPSVALAITGTDPTVLLRDNALVNTQIASGGGVNAKSYAIGMVTTTFANLDSNWNDFFASGAQAGFFRSGSLAPGLGTDYATVAAWGAAVSDDANSLQVDPLFVSATDPHLQPTSPIQSAGTPVAGVTVDFDDETRSTTAPAIGADELTADLAITKTDGVTSATPGGSVTYTITASNAGPAGTNATVADTFPAALTCTWTCVGAGGATCTAAGAGNINDAATLPSGGSVTYTASCTISAAASGTLSNTATVTGVAGDPVPANNSATDTDTLTAMADLAITKTDGVTSATPGGSVTYTIMAANAGPSNTTATVADTFPASLTCTWTCVGAGGGTCTAAGAGNINDGAGLPAGSSVAYTASCTISPAATGTLSNTATVTGAASDPNPGNNSATDSDTLSPLADLSITKNDGVTTATPGGSVTYTITASNAGPSNAPGSTVADTFPASLTCNWTCVGAGGGTCSAGASGNINDSANLPAGGSVTYTAVCSISASATGTLSNTATVAAAGGVSDPNPANNSATDVDTLVVMADIALAKTASTTTPTLGSNVIFTITATNNGPSNATGVTVSDLLPLGLAFVSATPSVGSYNNTTGLWTLGGLANGASATLTLTAMVNRPQALVNQASKSGAAEGDPLGANNTATIRLSALPLIDIQVSETVDDDTPGIGQTVSFLVTVRNAGPSNVTGVNVNDNLPAGLSFVGAVPSQGVYTPGAGSWNVGSLAAGASATLTVQMTNNVATPVVRTVTRGALPETDLVSGNDAASVVLNPQAAFADLALTKIAMQDPAAAGVNFSYTLVATNLGPNDSTAVSVSDTLPAGMTLISSAASQGSCTGTTTVICNLGALLRGGSATIDLVVQKTVGGNVANTAMVTAAEVDPNMSNNSNTATTTPVSLMGFEIE